MLKKKALDALLEGLADPEYAIHQHHSDPGFTTQTGKDYAGRGSTEPESGVSVAIPPEDLHTAASIARLFHGTSSKAQKQGVVEPPSFWGTERVAQYYAEVAAEEDGSDEVVLSMPLSAFDKSKLVPDDNSIAEPLTYTLGRDEEELYSEWEASEGTWQDSLRIYESVKYTAPIRLKTAAGSNSGDDDIRGAGDLWREEFYQRNNGGGLSAADVANAFTAGIEDEIEGHEFFKESDPEMNPVEDEIEEHAFFKEAPEFEMRRASAGQIPYAVKKAAMCECGHPFEIHSKPPDFGCPHEKDGCGCKGAKEKKASSDAAYRAAAEKYGVDFRGVTNTPATADNQYIVYNDPVSGTQFGLFVNEFSEDLFVERLNAARKRFGMPGVEKTASAKTTGHRVEDTGEYDEEKESRIRQIAQETVQYFEKGPMFDPAGDYLCRGCHYKLGNEACAFVEGDIDVEHGTCRYWKIADGKAPVELERKYDKKEAGYAERKDQPFGCKRCEFGGEAEKPDSEGRESWCQFFGMHILPNTCCFENNLPGDVTFNKDNTVNKRGNFVPLAALIGDAPEFLYHGTSNEKLEKILSEGIASPSYWGNEKIGRYYAKFGGRGGILFRLPISRFDQSRLKPDMKAIKSPILDDEDRERLISEWKRSSKTWQDSYDITGAVLYQAPVQVTEADIVERIPEWQSPWEKEAASNKLYHVTHTSKVPSIRQKGILPLQESNWVKAENNERYGESEIFAFTDPNDAVRWGGKMDWEFNKGMGTGKISIVTFAPGKEKWEADDADPLSQAANKGQRVKAHGVIKPEQILAVTPVTAELTRAVVKNQPVKLAGQQENFEALQRHWKRLKEHLGENRYRDLETIQANIPKVQKAAEDLIQLIESNYFTLLENPDPERANVIPSLQQGLKYLKNTKDAVNDEIAMHTEGARHGLYFRQAVERFALAIDYVDVGFNNQTVEYHRIDKKRGKTAGQREKFEALYRKWMPAFKHLDSMADRDVTWESLEKDAAMLRKLLDEVVAFVESNPQGALLRDAFIETKGIPNWLREADERLGIAEAYIKDKNESKADFARAEIMRSAYRVDSAFLRLKEGFKDMEMEREMRGYYAPTASTTKSYGTGTPLGGMVVDPNAEEEDDEETVLAAEEERIAAEIMASDKSSLLKSASLASKVDGHSFRQAAYKLAESDDAGWFAKSARPTDQKIELLQKQFKVTPEQVELAIAADPSPNQTDYVAWIAKWLSKGAIRLPEDSEKIKGQLAMFTKLKRSPTFTHNKDIQQYDPAKLFEVLNAGSAAPALSKKEQEREAVAKGSKIVVDQDGLTIYKVTDPKALSLLSGGTNWCTAQDSFAARYLNDGPSYVMFENGSAFAQFHPASDQLMNRQDVCMLERVYGDKPRTRGWGRSAPKAELIASFITDQTLLRALQLLAKVEPGVEEWVKENTSDPAQLVEILGEKAAEEQRKNEYDYGYSYYGEREKSWRMTVQHALASGQQLGPEMEAKLEKGVSIDLLFKYGARFHAGQRWAPLEKAILAQRRNFGETIDYAVEFLKGRWPEGEAKLLKGALLKTYESSNMKFALEYAQRVIRGRWPELEAKFHKAKASAASGYGSAEYAINILKQRWTEVGVRPRKDGKLNEEEIMIIGAPGEAEKYAATFMPGQRWPEFERSALEAGHISALTDYAANVVKGRMPEVEKAILGRTIDLSTRSFYYDEPHLALEYAKKVLKGRWPEYEQKILNLVKSKAADPNSNYGKTYTPSVSSQSYHHGARLPRAIEEYIEQMLGGRWPELEQELLARYPEHPADWPMNQTFLDGYLRVLRDLCYKNQLAAVNNFEADAEKDISKDAQCVWPEGEKRLQSRDKNYERALLQKYKERNDKWHADSVAKGGSGEWRNYEWRNYKGVWVTSYGNTEIEEYVRYLDSIGQNWPLGDEFMDEIADLESKRYGKGLPRPPRRVRPTSEKAESEPQPVTSSLLKKAIVPIHETPKMLPPREQYREHIDPEAEAAAMEGVMDGVKQPLDGKPQQPRRKTRHEQFDPSLGGNGEHALMQQKMPEGFPQLAAKKFRFPEKEVERAAYKWFNANARRVQRGWEGEMSFEVGFTIYLDQNGKVQATKLARGTEAEVEIPNPPKGCVALGSLHTHSAEGGGELSPWDSEEGQRISNEQGTPYWMFVVGPDPFDETGYPQAVMTDELFEPEAPAKPEKKKSAETVDPEILPKRTGNWKLYAWPAGTVQFGEVKRPVPKGQVWYVGDKKNAIPIMQENWELTQEEENQLLERGALNLPDVILRLTNVDYYAKNILPAPTKLLKGSLLKKADRGEREMQELLRRTDAEADEVRQAFMREPYVLQEAQDRRTTPEALWGEIGKEYSAEYFAKLHDRDPQDWHAPR